MTQRISIQILGGTASEDNPTGSCHLLRIKRKKQDLHILIDSGLYQGKKEDCAKKNRDLKIDASRIDCIIATHEHIDHIGRIPYLVKQGFKKSIYCTKQAASLLSIMLNDTANIFKKELQDKLKKIRKTEGKTKGNSRNSRKDYARREAKKSPTNSSTKRKATKNNSSASSYPDALYSAREVEESLRLVKNDGFEYEKWIRLEKDVELKFYSSGHVLGGAICVIKIAPEKSTEKPFYIAFSGDLGRKDGIILPPPAKIMEPIDRWITESTYGGKTHPPREEEIKIWLDLLREAYEKKSPLIIPSFALERTQEILYLISYYMQQGIIPEMPIYLDSPMARRITNKYADQWDSLMFKDQSMLSFNPYKPGENPFLKIIESDTDSLALAKSSGPHIVIAASGMCDHGRIRNHLKIALENPNAIICLVGFMAEGTLGEKLRKGFPIVNMNDHEVRVRAKIVSFGSFSAHADGPYLVEYTSELMKAAGPEGKMIIIVHGIKKGGLCLKAAFLDELGYEWQSHIIIPELNEIIELAA